MQSTNYFSASEAFHVILFILISYPGGGAKGLLALDYWSPDLKYSPEILTYASGSETSALVFNCVLT